MNITSEIEKTGVELRREQWKLEIGLPHSKKKIHKLEARSAKLYEALLKMKVENTFRRYAIDEVAHAKTAPLYLKLHSIRENNLNFTIKGKKITWAAWRQFNTRAPDEYRKIAFEQLIARSKILESTINKRFNNGKKVFKQYNDKVFDNYLFQQGISEKQLRRMLFGLIKVRKDFLKEFNGYSRELFGREPRYYDDLYVMRNRTFENIKTTINVVTAYSKVKSTARSLGLDKKIKIDLKNRRLKTPSAFCTFIKVPSDIRISVKPEKSSLQDAVAVFHEYGHAVHAANIDEKLPYWQKNCLSTSLCETFSQLFENLLCNERFLTKEMGITKEDAKEIVKRAHFVEKYVVAFYAANSLFKMEYWRKNMTIKQANRRYAYWYKRCVGIEMPGEYWLLHHILPDDFTYVPSYLISRIKVSELDAYLCNKYGDWWRNPKAGEYLKSLMEPGALSSLKFNNPKPELLLKEIR